jgi:3D (Asp-Asp-Asp) domain-containing protein
MSIFLADKKYLFYKEIFMAQEIMDGKVIGSSGVAKAGLTLGIIGTGLAALSNGGNGILGGLFGGNNKAAELQSQVDVLTSTKYTDDKFLDMYTKLVEAKADSDARTAAVQGQLYGAVLELDKRTALNEQAQRLNREYDATVRDYMMTIINNKIDCCCEKMTMQANYEKQISELSDASIISYVNSNFLSGVLKLPASNISPNVQLA